MPKPTPWEQRRQRDLAKAGIREGPDYLYRPRQCLVATADLERLRPHLRRRGVAGCDDQHPAAAAQARREPLDHAAHGGHPAAARPAAGARGRRLVPVGRREHRAGRGAALPGWARGEPATCPAGPGDYGGGAGLGRVEHRAVGAGHRVRRSVRSLHASLAARLRPDPDDVDVLDTEGDQILDFEAAHGTFICGLAHRLAPQLRIDPERVLDPRGWGDDLSVAIGMAQQRSPVVNCSFGGYTEDDRAPTRLAGGPARPRPQRRGGRGRGQQRVRPTVLAGRLQAGHRGCRARHDGHPAPPGRASATTAGGSTCARRGSTCTAPTSTACGSSTRRRRR